MLDIRAISDNPDYYKEKLKTRGDYNKAINNLLADYNEKRQTQRKADELRNQRKTLSKTIGFKKSRGESADDIMSEVSKLKETLEGLENREKELDKTIHESIMRIPNIPTDEVPIGSDDTYNEEIKKWGTPREFDFKPLEHHEIGENLKILDFERGTKLAGTGFILYRKAGARLERALIQFMLDTHIADGFDEAFLPFLVNSDSLSGTGQLPKFKDDLYHIENEDLFLNPTAEVALVNIFRGEILDEKTLPISITAYSPSFRKEAGSYGKDTRGLIRVHQFNKVELVKLCRPDESEAEHQKILAQAEKILQLLELPYRIVILSTGDTGFSAAKCYDIEVWLPGQKRYREISSASNTMDFQARRANIRYRDSESGKMRFVHTLNASGLAVGRTMVAILENYQQADGSVKIPDVLQAYMGGMKIIKNEKIS